MKLEVPIDCEVEQKPLLFPSGESQVVIESIKQATTRKGGWMLNVQMCNQKNQKIFDRINLGAASMRAREIATQQMQQMGKACGISKLEDTDELIGKSCVVRVEHKNDPQYGWQAIVKKYLDDFSGEQGDDIPF